MGVHVWFANVLSAQGCARTSACDCVSGAKKTASTISSLYAALIKVGIARDAF